MFNIFNILKSSPKNPGDKKDPRFICETCDTEVPKDAKVCPECGSRFSSVRCPSCEFIGEEELFKEGCPNCGYSALTGEEAETKSAAPKKTRPPRNSRENYVPASALPLWVYFLTAAIFTAIMAALFLRFLR